MKNLKYVFIYVAIGFVLGIVFVNFYFQLSRYADDEKTLIMIDGIQKSGQKLSEIDTSLLSEKDIFSKTINESNMGIKHEHGVGSIKDISEIKSDTTKIIATTTKLVLYVRTKPFIECGDVTKIEQIVPITTAPAHLALTRLFVQDLTMLRDSYLGVSIKNGRAIVNFNSSALTELNGTSCQQANIKTPIEKTLLQFNTIRAVDYSIDGIIKEEWSA